MILKSTHNAHVVNGRVPMLRSLCEGLYGRRDCKDKCLPNGKMVLSFLLT